MATTKSPYPAHEGKARARAAEKPQYVYVIHPYYTGRDKGCLCNSEGPLLFMSPGHAWWYVFHKAQPDDQRSMDNYRVITLADYQAGK
jgi:hypothetical protein